MSPLGELLSPRGKLHSLTGFQCYDRASCVFLFPEVLVRTFFCLPRDIFIDISWWCRHLGRSLLPLLRLDFVIHEKLLWCFVSSLSSWLSFLRPSWVDFFTLFFRRYGWTSIVSYFTMTCFPTLRSDFLVSHPLGGPVWSIVFFNRSLRCCRFTVCRDSPLPRDRDRTSIEYCWEYAITVA